MESKKKFRFVFGGSILVAVLLPFYVYAIAHFSWFYNWLGIDLSKMGPLGDAINGISAPVIGFMAVVLLTASFWTGNEANKLLKTQNDSLANQNQFNSLLNSIDRLTDDIIRLNDFETKSGYTIDTYFGVWGNNYTQEFSVKAEYIFQTYFDISEKVWAFQDLWLIRRMHTIFNTFFFNRTENLLLVNDPNSKWYKSSVLFFKVKNKYDEFEDHLIENGELPDTVRM